MWSKIKDFCKATIEWFTDIHVLPLNIILIGFLCIIGMGIYGIIHDIFSNTEYIIIDCTGAEHRVKEINWVGSGSAIRLPNGNILGGYIIVNAKNK